MTCEDCCDSWYIGEDGQWEHEPCPDGCNKDR